MRMDGDGVWWRATRAPEGPATTRLRQVGDKCVSLRAWGPGAEWAIEAAPQLLGARDSLEGFDPPAGPVRELHRRLPGLRIPRSNAVFEATVPSILEQKVTGMESRASYRALVKAWGEPAPGPGELVCPPAARKLREVPYYAFHPLGVEMRRANVIRMAARHAHRLEAALSLAAPDARRLLGALPGIGPWTAAEVAGVALGDADAVPLGDFHVPHMVSWALAGEPRADDARMLELLEPYVGHRGRVIRLLVAGGIRAPRYGPRSTPRSFRGL